MGKKKIRYHRCSCCNNKAVWVYVPYHVGKIYYCDNCVPRGCSCNLFNKEEIPEMEYIDEKDNIKYWDDESVKKYTNGEVSNEEFDNLGSLEKKINSTYYEILDGNNRRLPCCEYDYNEEGFEIEIPDIMVEKEYIIKGIDKVIKSNYLWSKYINWGRLKEYIKSNYGDSVNYNKIFDNIRLNIRENFDYDNFIKNGNGEYRSKGIIEMFIYLIRNQVREKRYKKYSYE